MKKPEKKRELRPEERDLMTYMPDFENW